MGVDWFELGYRVIGGLAVFLFGMRTMSEGLQALASDFLRRVIGWLTTNRLLAVLVGTVATVIIQSSSVTTVMVVGFVNAGLMSLTQAVGVILGANVGTTITGWIVALKIGKYGLVFLAAGLVPYFFIEKALYRNLGRVSIALGFVFLGLEFMSGGFEPLTRAPGFAETLTWFQADTVWSVVACVAVGCGLTFVVQSSSAMLGITIALATTASPGGQPLIGLDTAVALVLGENIGTTVTAQLASIGGNIVAKRAAWAHTLFNVLGVTVMIFVFRPYMVFIEKIVQPAFDSMSVLFRLKGGQGSEFAVRGFQIAAAHSLFNVTNVILFLPFIDQLAKLTEKLRPDTGEEIKSRLKLLGDVTQIAPSLAITQAEDEVELLCDVTNTLLEDTRALLDAEKVDRERFEKVLHGERITDRIQMEVTLFLTTVLQVGITAEQAARAYALIRIADEVESVADGCENLARYQVRLEEKGQQLSTAARAELVQLLDAEGVLFRKVRERIAEQGDRVPSEDLQKQGVELGELADSVRALHLDRVQSGQCDALTGLTFSDIIMTVRRMRSHTINMLEARNSRWRKRFAPRSSRSPAKLPLSSH